VVALLLVTPPRYTANAQIMVDPRELRIVRNDVTPEAGTNETATTLVESHARIVSSDNVLMRVIERQNLADDPEFNGTGEPGLPAIMNGLKKALGGGGPKGDPSLEALEALGKKIRVRRAERTFVIDVNVQANNAEKAARIANGIVDAYLDDQRAARLDQSRRATAGLSGRLVELRDAVRIAENKAEEFKAKNNIVGAGGRLVSEQQLAELNEKLIAARARTAEARARFEETQRARRTRSDGGGIPEAVQSQTVGSLRAQLAEVTRQESDLRARLGDRHPSITAVQQQQRDIRRLIEEEVGRIADSARVEFDRARANEQSLARSVEELRQTALNTSQAFVRLRELERDVEANRAVYEAFLVRARETQEQEGLSQINARAITVATPPLNKSWPPRMLLTAAALMFGLAAGAAIAIGREAGGQPRQPAASGRQPMPAPAPVVPAAPSVIPAATAAMKPVSTRVSESPASAPTSQPAVVAMPPVTPLPTAAAPAVATQAAVPPVVAWPRPVRDLPVIAALAPPRRKPFARQAPVGPSWARGLYAAGLVYADMEDTASDYTSAVLALRTALRTADGHGRSRIVAVGSSETADHASLTAVNIALAAAAAGERVLLVDASRNAVLSQHAVPKAQIALDDVLSGTASLADALIRDELTGIHLLPGRGIVMATRETLLRDLSHVVPLYDLILLDAGRLSPAASTSVAVEAADDLVLVAPADAGGDVVQRIASGTRKFRGMVTVREAA
jgi:uncharacterized protein involved in exopolysaccharide biosynthesis/Mrp family chromosome partitioning ATPase